MNYIYIDGDNIGLKIEMSFLNNDEDSLKLINSAVVLAVRKITDLLIKEGQEVIFSGADGIICKGNNISTSELLEFVRLINTDLTFSIGCGKTLKDSYIALRYAKSLNKNIAVTLENGEFRVDDGIKKK